MKFVEFLKRGPLAWGIMNLAIFLLFIAILILSRFTSSGDVKILNGILDGLFGLLFIYILYFSGIVSLAGIAKIILFRNQTLKGSLFAIGINLLYLIAYVVLFIVLAKGAQSV